MSDPAKPRGLDCATTAKEVALGWIVDEVGFREYGARRDGVPILLVLPQSDGAELSVLKERSLLSMTEGDTLEESETEFVIAVAQDVFRAGYLKRIIYGLRVRPEKTREFLDKASASAEGDAARHSQARVVNFDRVDIDFDANGVVGFVNDLEVLCKLRDPEPADWSLCFWVDTANVSVAHANAIFASAKAQLENALTTVPELADVIPELHEATKKGWSAGGTLSLLAAVSIDLSARMAPLGWRVAIERAAKLASARPGAQPGLLVLRLSKESGSAIDAGPVVERLSQDLARGAMCRVAKDGTTHVLS